MLKRKRGEQSGDESQESENEKGIIEWMNGSVMAPPTFVVEKNHGDRSPSGGD